MKIEIQSETHLNTEWGNEREKRERDKREIEGEDMETREELEGTICLIISVL